MSDSRVLAVVVLYGMSAEQSSAFCGLRDAGLAAEIDVMVFDNSPEPQPTPAGFRGLYLRDQRNPGLAAAYNAALNHAGEHCWLLLLDQDTTVTGDFLTELLSEIAQAADNLCAFVPKLLCGTSLLSPLIPPFSAPGVVTQDLHGIPTRPLHMFNSGAALRVSALRKIGGFPLDFPIDSLDHATFHMLQAAGGEVYVLRSGLQHALAQESAAPSVRRQRSILAGQADFYRRFGTPLEQRSFRRDLVRRALLALRAFDLARAGRLLLTATRGGGGNL